MVGSESHDNTCIFLLNHQIAGCPVVVDAITDDDAAYFFIGRSRGGAPSEQGANLCNAQQISGATATPTATGHYVGLGANNQLWRIKLRDDAGNTDGARRITLTGKGSCAAREHHNTAGAVINIDTAVVGAGGATAEGGAFNFHQCRFPCLLIGINLSHGGNSGSWQGARTFGYGCSSWYVI